MNLADLYAEEVGALIYKPHLCALLFHSLSHCLFFLYVNEPRLPVVLVDVARFGGEVPPQRHDELLKYILTAFRLRNAKHIRRTKLHAYARKLRQHTKVGVVDCCFGGWAGLDLGFQHNSGDRQQFLVDCISIAHPAWVEESELRNVRVPTQITAPEHDNSFHAELKKLANGVISRRE